MLQERPGRHLRLRQGGEGSCFLHNSRYDFNDGAVARRRLVRSLARSEPTRSASAILIGPENAMTHREDPSRCCSRIACGPLSCRRAARGRPGRLELDGPHSLNESLQLSFTGNVYEPLLVGRDSKICADAGAGDRAGSRPRRRSGASELRGVLSDGTLFTADDVLFTFARAGGDGGTCGYTNGNQGGPQGRRPPSTSRPVGAVPHPSRLFSLVYIMSKSWCEENKAKASDRRASRTRPRSYQRHRSVSCCERQPARTVLVRNFNYWGRSRATSTR